jgi:hypothetical protein
MSGEQSSDAVSAVDRWEKSDTVATQVVEQPLVAGMSADDANSLSL